MESLLRDLGDARDACNNLPFDDALRDKIATELDRCSASRAHVGDEAAGQEVGGIGQPAEGSVHQDASSGCAHRHAARRRPPPRSGAKPRCAALVEIDGRALGSAAMLEGARAGEASAGEAS
ncbi:hypothetical protein EMIHUDRAFT_355530, partial [Emiliania huxleyi CCMP1516]|uniref:UVR domain-containing protein n=2 Tax=Emiliania huxleyi TaxID=2903 RepID=A0A0D3J5I6_EMIH1